MKISELNKKITELEERKQQVIVETRALAEDEKSPVEDVQKGVDKTKDIQKQIDDLKKQVETIQEALDMGDDDEKSKSDSAKDNTEGEQRSMQVKVNKETQTEEVRDFIKYIKNGEKRAALSTVDGAAIIPKEILDVVKIPTDATELAHYVNRVAVKSGQGTLPVLQKNNARLVSVAELQDNPEVDGFQIKNVDYKAIVYRGVLPISFELAQDAPNIESLVQEYVVEAKNATENAKIADVLKTATAVSATTVDDLKKAFNVGLANYSKMWVVSESFYNAVDLLKDNNGRYLLQDSISSASGKTLFGAPVLVVADNQLGADGEAHAFVGDVKSFAVEALRSDIVLKWDTNENFQKNLAVALRADFKSADTNAGKFITFGGTAGH